MGHLKYPHGINNNIFSLSLPAWLRSAHESVETVSVGSSESFADQGYAASEGMAEEPGPVSPSEMTQSPSSVDIMSLNGGSAVAVKQSKDSSSDSDEGCATWGSRHRYTPITTATDLYNTQKMFFY